LLNSDARLRKGQLILGTTKTCKIRRVGQDTMAFVEKPNMSEVVYQSHYNNNNNNNWSRNDQQQQQQQKPQQSQQSQPSQQQQKQSNRIPNNVHNRPSRYQNYPYNNNSVNNSNSHRGGLGGGLGGRRGQYHDNNRGRGGRYQQGIDNPVL
jgi:hypothetical protein